MIVVERSRCRVLLGHYTPLFLSEYQAMPPFGEIGPADQKEWVIGRVVPESVVVLASDGKTGRLLPLLGRFLPVMANLRVLPSDDLNWHRLTESIVANKVAIFLHEETGDLWVITPDLTVIVSKRPEEIRG